MGEAHEVSVRPVPVAPLGNVPAAGVLGDGDDADVWGFDGVAGQVVSARVRVAGEGTPYLERRIISPTGEFLDAFEGWEKRPPHMPTALPVDGRYLVRLSWR